MFMHPQFTPITLHPSIHPVLDLPSIQYLSIHSVIHPFTPELTFIYCAGEMKAVAFSENYEQDPLSVFLYNGFKKKKNNE